MKKILLISLLCFSLKTTHGQSSYKWDKIDSVGKTKTEIYSLTKMYIGETWKSANEVIQNDDKESGVILVKGINVQTLFYQMYDHKWGFSYSVKFMFKDRKCRIVLENVFCESARVGAYEWPHMPVSDTYPDKGFRTTGVNQERYLEIMKLLKSDLQRIVDGYSNYVNNAKSSNSDW